MPLHGSVLRTCLCRRIVFLHEEWLIAGVSLVGRAQHGVTLSERQLLAQGQKWKPRGTAVQHGVVNCLLNEYRGVMICTAPSFYAMFGNLTSHFTPFPTVNVLCCDFCFNCLPKASTPPLAALELCCPQLPLALALIGG
jgi:hypothetical protein